MTVPQNLLVKTVPLSEVIPLGHPKSLRIYNTNISASLAASIVFLVGMYHISFVYLLTITNIVL
jgi:hypothetical protein